MVTNLQIMSESPEYKEGSEQEEELTVEEKKAIAQTLKKIRKKKLEKRTEDEADTASDVEEIVSPGGTVLRSSQKPKVAKGLPAPAVPQVAQ